VAINGCFDPRPMLADAGLTAIDVNTAEVTVSCAVPALPVFGSVAVIVIGPPMAFEVANPLKPIALLIVAPPVFDEIQVTDDVRSCLVRSVKIPVAINC